MTGSEATCWKCGAAQEDLLLPLSRTEECRSCGADLHVCRICRFYDTSVSNACREPVADFVSDKTRANFCGYLEIRPDAHTSSGTAVQETSKDGLNSLFGLEKDRDGMDAAEGSTPASLDDLFGLKNEQER
jgi:hypothetical protein